VSIFRFLFVVAVALVVAAFPADAANKKKPTPQQQKIQQELRRQQQQVQNFMRNYYNNLRNIPFFGPLYPNMPYYAGQVPYGRPLPPGTVTSPTDLAAGFDREITLDVANNASVSALRPGSKTAYGPSGYDAVKQDCIVQILVKQDPPGDKPQTWSLTGQVLIVEPKKLTLKARLDNPNGAEFTEDNKVISAITIKSTGVMAAAAAK
jgi:hypothetical protein